MAVGREQLLETAERALGDLGIKSYTDLHLTFIQKHGTEWRVNFSYTPTMSWTKTVGCFSVSIQTGEITFTALDKVWKP